MAEKAAETMPEKASVPRKQFGEHDPKLQELIEALTPFASKRFVKYASDDKVAIDQDLLLEAKDMWIAARATVGHSSFTKSGAIAVMRGLADKEACNLPDDDGIKQKWAEDMGKRFQLQGRHTQQSVVKKTKWALEIFNLPSHAELAATDSAVEYEYGWDSEFQKAWRKAPGVERELTGKIVRPKDGEAFELVVAHYDDGSSHATKLTCAEYDVIFAKKKPAAHTYLWTGHDENQIPVTVGRKKVDGAENSLIICHGKGQVCQLKAGTVDDDIAVRIMSELAGEFAEGTISRIDLKKEKADKIARILKKADNVAPTVEKEKVEEVLVA